jgi:hypothetical protein
VTGLRQQFIDRQTTTTGRRFAFDTLRVFLLATGGAAAFLFDESSELLRALIAAAWVLVMVLLAVTIVTRARFGGGVRRSSAPSDISVAPPLTRMGELPSVEHAPSTGKPEADGDQANGSESDGS